MSHQRPHGRGYSSTRRLRSARFDRSGSPSTSSRKIADIDRWRFERTRRGHLVRILNVVDEYTRVALGVLVKGSIGAIDVKEFLGQLFEQHGAPRGIRSDNGREFIASTVIGWLGECGVEPIFVEKASPQQNSFIERFNGTMRDEVLYGEEFDTLLEARVVIQQWLEVYNTQPPHRNGLGMLTPQAFAMAQNRGLE